MRPRRLVIPLIAATLVGALTLAVGDAPPPAQALGNGVEFDLLDYLATSDELRELQIDPSGLTVAVTGYTVRNQAYKTVGQLGYKSADFINDTTVTQTQSTVSRMIADARTVSYSNQHAFDISRTIEQKLELDLQFASVTASQSIRFGYTYTTTQTATQQTTDTIVLSPQTIAVPAHTSAHVEEWYEQGTITADIDLDTRVTGTVALSRCGRSVNVPIGGLVAMRDELGLAPLPDWIAPAGDALAVHNTIAFSTTRASSQLVRVTSTPIGGGTPIVTGSMTPPPSGNPSVAAPTTDPGTKTSPDSGASTVDLVRGLIHCAPATSDGALLLGPNGDIYDPASGVRSVAPDGATFAQASGLNARGMGLYISAITADGVPYSSSPGHPLHRVTIPTRAQQTADGSVLLGADGLVYDAYTGERIPSPSGVRFLDVSARHLPGVEYFVSAVATDGRAYWATYRGSLRRVATGARIVSTSDAVALLGDDGNVYNAWDGKVVANPSGARMVAASGNIHPTAGASTSAIDDQGNAYFTAYGYGFTRLPLPVAVTATADGAVLLGADGTAYSAWEGRLLAAPSGVRFVAASGMDDWGVTFVSAITEDGTPYWSNKLGAFTKVDY